MKVLLVATNQADRYMDRMVVRPVPIGLAYLAAHVDETQHQLSVLDLMFSKDAIADVGAAVESFGPDVVGLSIRNLDNQSCLNPVWNLPIVRDVVRRIRAASEVVTICGGPAFSILPARCLEFIEADLGIAGDGADAFAELIERIGEGEDYRNIPGLVYRDNGRTVVNEGRFSSGFQRPPRLDLLDMRRYDGSGFGVGVVTKLAQAYYPSPGGTEKFSGQDWRIRPVGEVVEEIRRLGQDYGICKVFFIDSGFNIPLAHARELCRAIIESGLRIRWNSYLRPGECDAELVRLMKESGCSLALLADVGGHETEEAEQVAARLQPVGKLAALCREADLPFTLTLSFGEPGETRATVEQKLSFLKEMAPAFATLRVGTRVLPNTSLSTIAMKEGLIQSEADLLGPTFYIAPGVRQWLADYLRAEAASYPRWNLV